MSRSKAKQRLYEKVRKVTTRRGRGIQHKKFSQRALVGVAGEVSCKNLYASDETIQFK